VLPFRVALTETIQTTPQKTTSQCQMRPHVPPQHGSSPHMLERALHMPDIPLLLVQLHHCSCFIFKFGSSSLNYCRSIKLSFILQNQASNVHHFFSTSRDPYI
jgi:hypothetical protein